MSIAAYIIGLVAMVAGGALLVLAVLAFAAWKLGEKAWRIHSDLTVIEQMELAKIRATALIKQRNPQ